MRLSQIMIMVKYSMTLIITTQTKYPSVVG